MAFYALSGSFESPGYGLDTVNPGHGMSYGLVAHAYLSCAIACKDNFTIRSIYKNWNFSTIVENNIKTPLSVEFRVVDGLLETYILCYSGAISYSGYVIVTS